jgi:flagellar hook assembly protein FlgD
VPAFTPPKPQVAAASTPRAAAATTGSTGTGGSTSSGNSTGSSTSTSAPQFDYMKLIVAQMQSLNPFDPSSGSNSLPEMMQAEELNEITQLQQAMQSVQASINVNTGASLLGRSVQALNASGGTVSGSVQTVQNGPGGVALVLSSGDTVRLQDVQSVSSS